MHPFYHQRPTRPSPPPKPAQPPVVRRPPADRLMATGPLVGEIWNFVRREVERIYQRRRDQGVRAQQLTMDEQVALDEFFVALGTPLAATPASELPSLILNEKLRTAFLAVAERAVKALGSPVVAAASDMPPPAGPVAYRTIRVLRDEDLEFHVTLRLRPDDPGVAPALRKALTGASWGNRWSLRPAQKGGRTGTLELAGPWMNDQPDSWRELAAVSALVDGLGIPVIGSPLAVRSTAPSRRFAPARVVELVDSVEDPLCRVLGAAPSTSDPAVRVGDDGTIVFPFCRVPWRPGRGALALQAALITVCDVSATAMDGLAAPLPLDVPLGVHATRHSGPPTDDRALALLLRCIKHPEDKLSAAWLFLQNRWQVPDASDVDIALSAPVPPRSSGAQPPAIGEISESQWRAVSLHPSLSGPGSLVTDALAYAQLRAESTREPRKLNPNARLGQWAVGWTIGFVTDDPQAMAEALARAGVAESAVEADRHRDLIPAAGRRWSMEVGDTPIPNGDVGRPPRYRVRLVSPMAPVGPDVWQRLATVSATVVAHGGELIDSAPVQIRVSSPPAAQGRAGSVQTDLSERRSALRPWLLCFDDLLSRLAGRAAAGGLAVPAHTGGHDDPDVADLETWFARFDVAAPGLDPSVIQARTILAVLLEAAADDLPPDLLPVWRIPTGATASGAYSRGTDPDPADRQLRLFLQILTHDRSLQRTVCWLYEQGAWMPPEVWG